jgi:hypothetical protein
VAAEQNHSAEEYLKGLNAIAGIVERSGELAGLPIRVHAHMLRLP